MIDGSEALTIHICNSESFSEISIKDKSSHHHSPSIHISYPSNRVTTIQLSVVSTTESMPT